MILAPTSLVPLNVLVNEHRLYLPLVGLLIAGAGLVGQWQRGRLLAVALGAVLALTTVQRNQVWSDELSLWADAAAKSPQMPRAQVHLGVALRQQGDRVGAENAFKRALGADSLHVAARVNLASLRLEAGARAASGQGRDFYLEAIGHCQRALAVDPDHREGLINLGNAYLFLGHLEAAEPLYRRAVERYPNFAEAHFNLGQLKVRQQLWGQAVGPLRQACALAPDEAEYFYRLGEILLVLGQQRLQQDRQQESQSLWREAHRCFLTVGALAADYPGLGKRLTQVKARLL